MDGITVAKIALSAATYAIDKPYDYTVPDEVLESLRPGMRVIVPPSFEELSRRLHRRATDQEEVIQGRLRKAREEYQQICNYDYLVVNDKVSAAAEEIIAILTAEGCRTKNRMNFVEVV